MHARYPTVRAAGLAAAVRWELWNGASVRADPGISPTGRPGIRSDRALFAGSGYR